jgi:hypothetical protein
MIPEMDKNRWEWLANLDNDLLEGGVITSDFSSELIRNADLCYASGAFVACLLVCGAAIETWLREEGTAGNRFVELIDDSDFDNRTKAAMHALRRNRNRWVHIDVPWEENDLEDQYSKGHERLEKQCKEALRLMRTVVYSTPFI